MLIDAVLFLALASFGPGQLFGVDRYIDRFEVGVQQLVDRSRNSSTSPGDRSVAGT